MFAVDPHDDGQSFSQIGSYWSVAKGFDTMFSLRNPKNSAQDFIVTFYYGDGSGQYNLPVHLDAQASKAEIRAGRHCPHPKHWLTLAQLVGFSPDVQGGTRPRTKGRMPDKLDSSFSEDISGRLQDDLRFKRLSLRHEYDLARASFLGRSQLKALRECCEVTIVANSQYARYEITQTVAGMEHARVAKKK